MPALCLGLMIVASDDGESGGSSIPLYAIVDEDSSYVFDEDSNYVVAEA